MRKFLTFILLLIIILAIFPLYSRFKVSAAPIAPGVVLGGLELSNLKDRDEIARHFDRIYREPIVVNFGEQRLVLDPAEVDFTLDIDQMMGEAAQYLDGPDFLDIALRAAVGMDQQTRHVPVRFLMDSDALRAWLQEIAAEYNSEPQGPRLLPPAHRWQEAGGSAGEVPPGFVGSAQRDWLWTDGAPGYTLDVEASIPLIIAALTSHEQRTVDLVLDATPPRRPDMDDLSAALDSYTADFPGFAAAYVHDFVADESAVMDADVAFSGMSTLKIAIVAAAMNRLDGLEAGDPVAAEVGQWIDFALGESNNYAANLIVSWLGDGDTQTGARRVTEFMRALGFESTYMQSGYDFAAQLAPIPTPGNQRDDWNTNPDANLQSTAREMGELLSDIYACTLDEGRLRTIFADSITPEECRAILFYMGHDEFRELLWSGLPRPEDAWILHKHGFAYESHSDVALVWGPTGPYTISVFLYRAGWLDWETSNGAMRDISRIVWNFFEQQQAFDAHVGQVEESGEQDPGPPPVLAPPPAYVPLGNYVPAG